MRLDSVVLPKYFCTQCNDQVGFFMASAGMLCAGCQKQAEMVQDDGVRIPVSMVEQVVELERMIRL